MTEPILSAQYWKERLAVAEASGTLHHSIFRCPEERWRLIEAKHRAILAKHIGPHDFILDVGCGWGRLLTLMPIEWDGDYTGVDISPDFIARALALKKTDPKYVGRQFLTGDIRTRFGVWAGGCFDTAVMISFRPMVRRNLGGDAWADMEKEIKRLAKRLLYLEYDPTDSGSLE